MANENPKDPLHGITLEMIITQLQALYGWERLGELLSVKCFKTNPSINSSLKFFRKTPWARVKIENLYLKSKANL